MASSTRPTRRQATKTRSTRTSGKRQTRPASSTSEGIRREVEAARTDPVAASSFAARRLNLGPDGDGAGAPLFRVAELQRVFSRPAPPRLGHPVVGIDIGGSRTWTAAVAVWLSARIEVAIRLNLPSSTDPPKDSMTRTFRHEFYPYGDSPIPGPNVELTVEEIEDAGLREVLQAPGAPFGSWAILDGLLEPTGDYTPFIFREPLGQSREVKVALSGLFGRFVARAYLERYFNLSIFAHVTESRLLLNGSHEIEVVRRGGGDLPTGSLATLLSGISLSPKQKVATICLVQNRHLGPAQE